MIRTIAYLMMLAAVAVSCTTRPLQLTDFKELGISKGLQDGVELSLDMEDTANIVMLQICMQINNSQVINDNQTIHVAIETISPDSIRYKESIELPLNVHNNGANYALAGGIRNYQWPYRRNIRNHTPGRWTFTIIPQGKTGEGTIYNEIIGVGISCRKEELEQ